MSHSLRPLTERCHNTAHHNKNVSQKTKQHKKLSVSTDSENTASDYRASNDTVSSDFIQSILHLPEIHPFIHQWRCQPRKVTTNTSGVVRVRRLARHLARWSPGIEPATFLLPDRLPPPELLTPVTSNYANVSII